MDISIKPAVKANNNLCELMTPALSPHPRVCAPHHDARWTDSDQQNDAKSCTYHEALHPTAIDLTSTRPDLHSLPSLEHHQGPIERLFTVTPSLDEFSPECR